MFLPIGDSPNPERFTPWVNYGLIAINVVVFFFTFVMMSSEPATVVPEEARAWVDLLRRSAYGYQPSQYDVFTYLHGFKPAQPELGDVMAAMFLHGGWAHLFGNMLFLWIYGDNVEHRLGRVQYLVVYLVTGVVATVAFGLLNPSSSIPLIGASGAISGVLGLYFIMFPRNVVKVFTLFFPFFIGVYPFNARLVLGFYIVFQNVFPALFSQGSNVAYGAHIGGFVAGLAIALVTERMTGALPRATFRPPPKPTPSAAPAPAHMAAPSVPPQPTWSSAEQSFQKAVVKGDRTQAFRQLSNLSVSQAARRFPNESVTVARWLADEEQLGTAFELVRKVLHNHRPPSVDQAEVYYTLGLIRLKQGQTTSAFQHFMDALDFQPRPETDERIRKALSYIKIYRRPN